MENDTKQNIIRKKKIKRQRRRLKIGRVLIFFFLLGSFLLILGWSGYHIYRWGSSAYQSLHYTYEEHERQIELKKQGQGPRFDGYTNILLLGIDDGVSGNDASVGRWADTIVLISFKKDTGDVRFLSVPRDTLVAIPGRKNPEQINAAYHYGGEELVQKSLTQLINVPIQEYISIDITGMMALVDALGGIDLYVEMDMDYEDPEADVSIHLKKGYQHLNGAQAQQYLRYRSDDLGDLGRVQRQQRFIKAVYEKCTQLQTLTNLPAVMDIFQHKLDTSLKMVDASEVITLLKSLRADHPQTSILPGAMAQDDSIWLPDSAKIEGKMQELFPVDTNQ
jgi:polyisoprenyl-teichoic acid--peptidoglycan teichoic acid transferase